MNTMNIQSTDIERFDSARLLQMINDAQAEQAWAELIKRHGARMLNVAYAILGDRAAAEDAVQNAFISILKNDAYLKQLADDVAVQRCLLTVTASRAKDIRKENIRRFKREQMSAEEQSLTSQESDEIDAEKIEQVREVLAELPEKIRRPIELRIFNDFDDTQLAENLSCSVNAARVRVHRALKYMAKRLQSRGISSAVLTVSALTAHLSACGIPKDLCNKALKNLREAWTPDLLSKSVSNLGNVDVPKELSLGKWAVAVGLLVLVGAVYYWPTGEEIPDLSDGVKGDVAAEHHGQGEAKMNELPFTVQIIDIDKSNEAFNANWRKILIGQIQYSLHHRVSLDYVLRSFQESFTGPLRIRYHGNMTKDDIHGERLHFALSSGNTAEDAMHLLCIAAGVMWTEYADHILIEKSKSTVAHTGETMEALLKDPQFNDLANLKYKDEKSAIYPDYLPKTKGFANVGLRWVFYRTSNDLSRDLPNGAYGYTFAAGASQLEEVKTGLNILDYDNIIDYFQALEDFHNIEIRFIHNQFIIYPAGPRNPQ